MPLEMRISSLIAAAVTEVRSTKPIGEQREKERAELKPRNSICEKNDASTVRDGRKPIASAKKDLIFMLYIAKV